MTPGSGKGLPAHEIVQNPAQNPPQKPAQQFFVLFCLASPAPVLKRTRYRSVGIHKHSLQAMNRGPSNQYVFSVDGGIKIARTVTAAKFQQFFDVSFNGGDVGVDVRYFMLGDFDSMSAPPGLPTGNSFHWEVHKLPTEKNLSDFAAALDVLANAVPSESSLVVVVLGGTGGRKDHELINFAEACSFANAMHKKRVACCMEFLEHSLIFNTAIELQPETKFEFSLLSVGENACLHVTGSKYDGWVKLLRPSHGLSNTVNLSSESYVQGGIEPKIICEPANGVFQLVLE